MKPVMPGELLYEGRAIAVERIQFLPRQGELICVPAKKVPPTIDNRFCCRRRRHEKASSYRRDLQGIRAIAIISVLLFHFYPSVFPNGHVGVDQFFVLSGFLMSMMCEREKNFDSNAIIYFYYRRVKRILPTYLLVVILSLICSRLFLFEHLQPPNLESAKYALLFTTNIEATDSVKEYQTMLTRAADLFTHTWSIAVEMQFYAVFPAIFVVFKMLPDYAAMTVLKGLGAVSLLYHIRLPPSQAFNFVHTRIWQFVLGVYVHQAGKKSEISGLSCGFILSLLVAVIITEAFEKLCLRAEIKSILYVVACLYAANLLMISGQENVDFLERERDWVKKLFTPIRSAGQGNSSGVCDIPFSTTSLHMEQVLRLNNLFTVADTQFLSYEKCTYRDIEPWGWFDLPKESGTPVHKIMVLGNSYATNQGRIVYEMCHSSEVEVKIFTIAAYEVITKSTQYEHCQNSREKFLKAVEEYKPDVMFILSRYTDMVEVPEKTSKSGLEDIVTEAASRLNELSQVCSAFRKHIPQKPAKLLNSTSCVDLARRRLAKSVSMCPKCSIIDYEPVFTFNGTFHIFDSVTNVAFMNGYWHLTPLGLHRLRPFYKNICDNITYSNRKLT
ncbi:hypothetical protein Aduo_003221 [Ancylostoma duodenale]